MNIHFLKLVMFDYSNTMQLFNQLYTFRNDFSNRFLNSIFRISLFCLIKYNKSRPSVFYVFIRGHVLVTVIGERHKCTQKRNFIDTFVCLLCFQDTKSKPNTTNNGTPENDEYEDNGEDALTTLPLFCIGKLNTK